MTRDFRKLVAEVYNTALEEGTELEWFRTQLELLIINDSGRTKPRIVIVVS